jgi:hypothetical protein
MTEDGSVRGSTPSERALVEVLRAAVGRLERLEAVAIEFCERCERGEIQSRYTYRRMRDALDGA